VTTAERVTIAVDAAQSVSELLRTSDAARACYVMAHGAGAGMTHPFMTAIANAPARTGRKDSEIIAEMAESLANWIEVTIPSVENR